MNKIVALTLTASIALASLTGCAAKGNKCFWYFKFRGER